jgi:ribose transport system substrate-binding protein
MPPPDSPLTIGFTNLTEKSSFTVRVREGLEAAVAPYPHVKLITRDNDMDNDQAMRNARDLAEAPVDVAILFHVDERAAPTIANVLLRRHIPVITIDIPIAPWVIYFGANNEQAGLLAGAALGKWIRAHWDSRVDKIVVMSEHRVLAEVRKRLDFALVALRDAMVFSPDDVLFLDSGNLRETAAERFAPILTRWSAHRKIAVIGFNDETALGALDAARAVGREGDLVAVGQGADAAISEFRKPDTRLIASTAYFPERYGAHLLDLARRMHAGETVPRKNYIAHEIITPDNVREYAGV